jgi:hypothetical protein
MDKMQSTQKGGLSQEVMRSHVRRLFDVSDKKVGRNASSNARTTERTSTLGSKMQGSITEEQIAGILDWIRAVARGGPPVRTFEELRDGVSQ